MKGRSSEEWRKIVDVYLSTGQTQSQWGKENGINSKQLSHWVRKFRKEQNHSKKVTTKNADNNFILANIIPNTKSQSEEISVKIGNAKIEVKSGFNQELLVQVVKVLETLC